MGKKNRHDAPPTNWDTERSLADAEADQLDSPDTGGETAPTACACGNRELLLQAYFPVTDGALGREPLEVEGLTCPECGREFEAVVLENGRIGRGEFVGYVDDEPDDDA